MNILLSAYACEPDKGSEPGVGWNWAIGLAHQQGHEVYVLTRTNNKTSITAAMELNPCDNLHFIYYDLPAWLKWWKKGKRGVHLYYLFWQIGIYFVTKKLIHKVSFEVIHHVTFVSVRQPSFLGLFGIPFIFGPVAGGERAAFRLRKSFPIRGWLTDLLRDVVNQWVRFSPLMRLTFSRAQAIYVTSEQSKSLVPKCFHKKTFVKLAIAADEGKPIATRLFDSENPIRVLYVGHFLYLKGVHLALRAFAMFLKQAPNARFTILGRGPDAHWLKGLAVDLSIDHAIDWMDWLPKKEVDSVYQSHHIFLFPSLRDSGGMVVLEAMSYGLPVVCLDLGGPGVIVNDSCGYKITTTGCSEDEVVSELGNALIDYSKTKGMKDELSRGASERAKQMGWRMLVSSVYPR